MKKNIMKTGGEIWVILAVVVFFTGVSVAASAEVKIGVLANRGNENCLRKWTPTAEYLNKRIPGETFVIIPIDYNRIYNMVKKKEVDFILANPSFYVNLATRCKINRIATLKNKVDGKVFTRYGSVIFCKKGREDIRNVFDLKGKKFIAVHENSLGGWKMTWREMKKIGLEPFEDMASIKFCETHDAVIYAVLNGTADAGTVREDTIERMKLENKIRMEDFHFLQITQQPGKDNSVLPTSRKYPEWPMANLEHVPHGLAEKVSVALIQMPENSLAAKSAKCGGWTTPLNYQSVHDCLKELGVSPYENMSEIGLADFFKKYKVIAYVFLIMFVTVSLFLSVYIVFNRKIKKANSELKKLIVEKLQFENALQKKEQEYRSIFTNTGTATVMLDENRMILLANSKFAELSGYAQKEIEGQKDFVDFVAPENRSKMKEFHRLRRKGRKDIPKNYEFIFIDQKEEKKHIYLTVDIIPGTVRSIASLLDITDWKRAEDALTKSNKKLNDLFSMIRLMCDNLPEPIWAKDLQNRFIFANRACCEKILDAKNPDEPIGRTTSFFSERVKKKYPENSGYHTICDSCMESDWAVQKIKLPKENKTYGNFRGKAVVFDLYKAPLMDDEYNVVGTVGCARDITEKQLVRQEKAKLEAQLLQAQKMESIGTLAGGIAHDFNNILFPILGYLEISMEDLPENSPVRKNLKIVHQEAIRARDLVSQILAFSRRAEKEKMPVDFSLLIKGALKLIRSTFPATIRIDQNIEKKCGYIMANATQIHQAAMNVFTNAFHAMENQGGTLTVGLKEVDEKIAGQDVPGIKAGRYASFSVTDTGPGMDQDTVSKIFDPYFTTKGEKKGTGLGLSVSLGIVKSHGGHIVVSSVPKKGTTFKILLPVFSSINGMQSASHSRSKIEKGQERILLVDDQDAVIRIEKKMLERMGYRVVDKNDNAEALKTFQKNPYFFDMVIQDLTMPGMPLNSLINEIKTIRPEIPIILCTGATENCLKNETSFLNIDGILLKPVTMNELSAKIREVLARGEHFDNGEHNIKEA